MNRGLGVALLAAVLLAAVLLAGCSSAPPAGGFTGASTDVVGETYYPPSHREAAPAISAATLAGSHLALADVLGRDVVVLNVWASWCIECRQESRGLARLSTALRGQGVRFVGIDEQDAASSARAFAANARTRYPQLVDPDGALLAELTLLPSSGIPSTLVIDRQGRVAGRIIGAADEPRLRRLIERVAADR
ncbi:MAG: TlpA family protein disulfide reductase [Actinomycetota bacterium]|nr:TlpA family protein disulfide reductase [Actinomycetota bacterium]